MKKHGMLADVEEEEQYVIFFDGITGKKLQWHAVRKACELESRCLRDLGVYEKIGVQWTSHQWPTLASSRIPDLSTMTRSLSIQKLPLPLRTALPLYYSLQ